MCQSSVVGGRQVSVVWAATEGKVFGRLFCWGVCWGSFGVVFGGVLFFCRCFWKGSSWGVLGVLGDFLGSFWGAVEVGGR